MMSIGIDNMEKVYAMRREVGTKQTRGDPYPLSIFMSVE